MLSHRVSPQTLLRDVRVSTSASVIILNLIRPTHNADIVEQIRHIRELIDREVDRHLCPLVCPDIDRPRDPTRGRSTREHLVSRGISREQRHRESLMRGITRRGVAYLIRVQLVLCLGRGCDGLGEVMPIQNWIYRIYIPDFGRISA